MTHDCRPAATVPFQNISCQQFVCRFRCLSDSNLGSSQSARFGLPYFCFPALNALICTRRDRDYPSVIARDGVIPGGAHQGGHYNLA